METHTEVIATETAIPGYPSHPIWEVSDNVEQAARLLRRAAVIAAHFLEDGDPGPRMEPEESLSLIFDLSDLLKETYNQIATFSGESVLPREFDHVVCATQGVVLCGALMAEALIHSGDDVDIPARMEDSARQELALMLRDSYSRFWASWSEWRQEVAKDDHGSGS